jgi:isoleucyl-tRNA synthetase
MPGARCESVLFETWYEGLSGMPTDAALNESDFEQLLSIRACLSSVLEPMRKDGAVGSSLAARVALHIDTSNGLGAKLAGVADDLRFLMISSEFDLVATTDPATAAAVIGGSLTAVPGIAAQLEVLPTSHAKCVRCWHFRADVGSHAEHPELCGRCVDNVDGAGERRRWF